MSNVTALTLRKALASNSLATSFTTKIPTTTAPDTVAAVNGVFDLTDPQYGVGVNGRIQRFIQLIPFGGNTQNLTYDMRVWGWSKTGEATPIWIPQLLLDVTCTLGSISATAVAANMLMVDTITINDGDDAAADISPEEDLSASVLLHLRGCERIEFDFDRTGADACNCFWRAVDYLR